MRMHEILETQPAKVSRVRPGVDAEIDHGDGTKTVVDLKKNPEALSKDEKGQIKMNKPQKPGQKQNPAKIIRPGDRVDIGDED